MLWFKKKPTLIDEQIASVLIHMEAEGPESEKYPKLMALLERLERVKAQHRRKPISTDTLAIVIGNLAGILAIVIYEQKHVLSSKGIMQILKPNQPKTPPL